LRLLPPGDPFNARFFFLRANAFALWNKNEQARKDLDEAQQLAQSDEKGMAAITKLQKKLGPGPSHDQSGSKTEAPLGEARELM